jgi:MFS family permease
MDMFGVGVAIGAGFTGLLSIFNMGGRFVWSSISDFTGRKAVYCIYFILGAVLYALLPYTQETQNRTLFVICTALIISMYGGGFATIPAYLKDMFGSSTGCIPAVSPPVCRRRRPTTTPSTSCAACSASASSPICSSARLIPNTTSKTRPPPDFTP